MNTALKIFATSFACLALVACNDEALDLNKTTAISNQAVWSTESAAEQYITASYKTFTDVSQVGSSRTDFYDSYSDLMKSTSWDQYNHQYNRVLLHESGFSTGSAGAFECWSSCYTRIRRANVLLNEIDDFGEKNYSTDWCNVRRAEVRFCRAFTYYRLIRVYGGVVLRTDKSGSGGLTDDGYYKEDVNRARLSEAESWAWVIDELKWAAQYLPESWSSEWTGRATKASAYGLLSRIAVHAQDWATAIEAYEKLVELGATLAPDYAKLFNVDSGQDNSKEVLFAIYFLQGSVTHNFDSYNRPFGDKAVYGKDVYAEHVPTGELADMYEFKDGTEFNWNTWSASHSDPYSDREPRFQATILYNGATWEGRKIQTYAGGADSFSEFEMTGSTNGHTCTGYYLKKYLQEGNTEFPEKYSYNTDNVLRFAEVLLNTAEAYARQDYAANSEKALACLNQVRNRVGLPSKALSDAADEDAFMSLVRKERCVELAGEGLRYWDLRRWKLAVNVINGSQAHGVKVTANSDGTFSYDHSIACDAGKTRIFKESYYYFSLPTAELSNNTACENNLYW